MKMNRLCILLLLVFSVAVVAAFAGRHLYGVNVEVVSDAYEKSGAVTATKIPHGFKSQFEKFIKKAYSSSDDGKSLNVEKLSDLIRASGAGDPVSFAISEYTARRRLSGGVWLIVAVSDDGWNAKVIEVQSGTKCPVFDLRWSSCRK